MNVHNYWLGRTFLVASLFVAVPVWADEPVKTAESVYIQGKRLADEGQWAAALALFKEAYAMDPSPKRAAHLGRAQVMTEHYAEGATNLERYLREEKDLSDDARAAVNELFQHAKTQVATVTLKFDDRGAKVRIDKQDLAADRWALPQYLAPGTHEFEVSKDGFVPTKQTRKLVAGQVVEVELRVGEVVKVDVPLAKRDEPKGMATKVKVAWGLAAGLGAVALGTSIGAWRLSGPLAKTHNDVQAKLDQNACDLACENQYEVGRGPLEALSWTAFATGALSGAAVVFALVSDRKPKDQPPTHASISLLPTLRGVGIHGTW